MREDHGGYDIHAVPDQHSRGVAGVSNPVYKLLGGVNGPIDVGLLSADSEYPSTTHESSVSRSGSTDKKE